MNIVKLLRRRTTATASPLLTDLVAYWKLDETSGTRFDSVGSANLTDVGGVGSAPGVQGSAASFDTTNRLERSGFSTQAGTSLSVSVWAKIGDPVGTLGNPGLISMRLPVDIFIIYISQGRVINSRVYQSDGSVRQVDGVIAPINTWTHVVFVADAATGIFTLWQDGVNVGSITYDGTLANVAGTLKVGEQDDEYLNGDIGKIAMYNRALSPAEIALLYNSGAGITYPFV